MKTRILWASVLTVISAASANANPITLPPGIAPGSTYFLVFETFGTRDAKSTNIEDYNAFVTQEANSDLTVALLGTIWKVIGSTAATSARINIGVTGPIYNLLGELVANDSDALFAGLGIMAPIKYDQHGVLGDTHVWTGSQSDGQPLIGHELGTICLDTNNSCIGEGFSQALDNQWIVGFLNYATPGPAFYGISGPLRDGHAVPEPGTVNLMLGPALLLLGTLRRRRQRLAGSR